MNAQQKQPINVSAEAVKLLALDWKLFPCGYKSKTPASKNGFHDATNDPALVADMFREPRNIGLSVLDSGLYVIDQDGPDGAKAFQELETQLGPLPETVEQATARGRHLFFRDWSGAYTRNGFRPGLDLKSIGYVLIPPSIHPSGAAYRWVRSPFGYEIAELPEPWRIFIAAEKAGASHTAPPEPHGIGGTTPYGRAALGAELEKLRGTGKGARNDTLNQTAFSAGQLVAGREIDEPEAVSEILAVALSIGLPEREARRTIKSGLSKGMASPRSAPESTGGNQGDQRDQRDQRDQPDQEGATAINEGSSGDQVGSTGAPLPLQNLETLIEEWVKDSMGCFTTADVDREFSLTSRQQKLARSRALYKIKEKNLISLDRVIRGKYHILDNSLSFVDMDGNEPESFGCGSFGTTP